MFPRAGIPRPRSPSSLHGEASPAPAKAVQCASPLTPLPSRAALNVKAPRIWGWGDSQENGWKPCGVRSKHVKLKEYGPGPCVQQEGVAHGVWELPGLCRPLLPPSPHSFLGATLEDLHPKARSKLLHSLPNPTSWAPLSAPTAMLCPTALTPTPTITTVQFVQRRATCPIPTRICLDTFSSVPSEWSKTPETRAPHTGSVALTRTPPHPTPP